MAWTAPRTWVTSEVVSAAIMNTHVRDNLLETAPAKADGEGYMFATGTNTLARRGTAQGFVGTSQTTTSTSYTDLATAGPEASLVTGTVALVIVTANMSNSTLGQSCFMSFAVTGASAVSASDTNAAIFESGIANQESNAVGIFRITGLTAGTNDFEAKYRVDANTGTFLRRRIIVFPA